MRTLRQLDLTKSSLLPQLSDKQLKSVTDETEILSRWESRLWALVLTPQGNSAASTHVQTWPGGNE